MCPPKRSEPLVAELEEPVQYLRYSAPTVDSSTASLTSRDGARPPARSRGATRPGLRCPLEIVDGVHDLVEPGGRARAKAADRPVLDVGVALSGASPSRFDCVRHGRRAVEPFAWRGCPRSLGDVRSRACFDHLVQAGPVVVAVPGGDGPVVVRPDGLR
jgi:hypothetical protein